jgi:hypothetical protein
MTTITTIGLDLAKKVFHVHGVDVAGNVVVARRLRRKEVLAFFAKLPPCLVGSMEACGSAHYWGREIAKLGHIVKLMPPTYVKPYVKRGKTDPIDAAAICEAVTRPSMSFVPVKGVEQQGLSMLHSARSQLIGQRTQLINAVRGHLSELGIIAARGLLGLAELAAIVRDESDQRLPVTARAALMVLVRQIETLSTEIAALDSILSKENKASELGPRLETKAPSAQAICDSPAEAWTAPWSPGSAFDHVANVPKQCFQTLTSLAPGLATSLATSQLPPSTTPSEVALAKGEIMFIDLGLLRGVPTRLLTHFDLQDRSWEVLESLVEQLFAERMSPNLARPGSLRRCSDSFRNRGAADSRRRRPQGRRPHMTRLGHRLSSC